MNPLIHQQLAADLQERHLQAAQRHRLRRQCRPPDRDRATPGPSAALGRALIVIGWRLVEHATARAERRTWAAG